jgi:outer membrane protein assembly factor BamB
MRQFKFSSVLCVLGVLGGESLRLPAAENASNIASPLRATAESWPMFRGDERGSGVAVSALPDDPQVLWKKSMGKDAVFESTAAIVDGVIYIGSLDGNFWALDLATGDEKWKFFSELGFHAPAAVKDGRVYVGDADGRFHCLDAATGKPLWAIATDAEINACANFYKDKVLVGSQDGSLTCLTAADGKQVWKYQIEDMVQSSPTIADHFVFLAGCDSQLHVIDIETGQATNKLDIGGPTGNAAAVSGDRLFFGSQSNVVLGVDWKKPEIVWEFKAEGRKAPYQSSAAVVENLVILGGRDRTVHCLDAASGQEKWNFPTKGQVDGSPVVVGRRVYIGSADGRLYGLDLQTGEKQWEYDSGSAFVSSPAVAAGRMVIGNDDGELLCFGAK